MSKFTQEQITEAASTALGRDEKGSKDAGLYAMYKDFSGDLNQLKRQFATSKEGQMRKVDASKFGVTYVDPKTLSAEDRKYYDAWQRGIADPKGKKSKIVQQMDASTLSDFKKYGTADLLEASLKNEAQLVFDKKTGKRTFILSKAAWERSGDKLLPYLHKNEVILVEKGAGAKVAGGQIKKYGGDLDKSVSSKYDVYTKEPKAHSGVLGSVGKAVGLSEGAADSLDRAAGHITGAVPLLGDETSAILGGTEGAKGRADMLEGAGIDRELLGKIDRVGDTVTQVAAGVGDGMLGGGPIFSSVNALAEGLESSTLGYETDWGEIGKGIAINWAAHGIGEGLSAASNAASARGMAGLASGANAANMAWSYGGNSAAVTAARGGNSEDVLMAAGTGLLMGFLPKDAATQGSVSFGLGYYDAKRRGYDDETAWLSASAAAATSAATSLLRGMPQNPIQSWKNQGDSLKQKGLDLKQGFGGTVPANWVIAADKAGYSLPGKQSFKTPQQAAAAATVRDPFGLRGWTDYASEPRTSFAKQQASMKPVAAPLAASTPFRQAVNGAAPLRRN